MPPVSIYLRHLIDLTSCRADQKPAKANKIRNRGPYDPATDFNKPLRDEIKRIFKNNINKSELDNLLNKLKDPKKIANYPKAIEGIQKWIGKKNVKWFDPPRENYSKHGVELIINPELGLTIDGQDYIVKLYLNTDALERHSGKIIASAMEFTLRPHIGETAIVGILDVRRRKFYSDIAGSPINIAAVNGEMGYLASMWFNDAA